MVVTGSLNDLDNCRSIERGAWLIGDPGGHDLFLFLCMMDGTAP